MPHYYNKQQVQDVGKIISGKLTWRLNFLIQAPLIEIDDSPNEDNDDDAHIKQFDQLIRRHDLEDVDLVSLSQPSFLTDRVLIAACNLLRKDYGAGCGLQDPIIGQTLNFQQRSDFIQILHTGANHWITVTNFGCERGEVMVMDSLVRPESGPRSSQISFNVKEQICNILQPKEDVLKLTVCPVQQQEPLSNDCGLFAVAFAQYVLQYKT